MLPTFIWKDVTSPLSWERAIWWSLGPLIREKNHEDISDHLIKKIYQVFGTKCDSFQIQNSYQSVMVEMLKNNPDKFGPVDKNC